MKGSKCIINDIPLVLVGKYLSVSAGVLFSWFFRDVSFYKSKSLCHKSLSDEDQKESFIKGTVQLEL